MIIISNHAITQNIKLSGEYTYITDSNISQIIPVHKAYNIDYANIEFQKELEISLQLENDFQWNLHLIENVLISDDVKSYYSSNEGQVENMDYIKTYKGYLNDNPENTVRISFFNNMIEGFIKSDDEVYRIIPLNRLSKTERKSNITIICKEKDILNNFYSDNDMIKMPENMSINKPELKSINYNAPVRIVRIAVEGDYEFYQNHGTNSNSYIISAINMASEVYLSTFNIVFRIVHINTYTTSNDPFTQTISEANMSDFLSEIMQHFNSSHTGVYRDVVFLFTGKPAQDDINGFAYTPGNYGVVRDLANPHHLFAHELGHNFNAVHEYAINCNTPNASIMCPSGDKKIPLYFSSENISRINDNISNRLITYSYFSEDALCGNATFSISNIPSNFTVTWPKSTNLEFNGNSTGSPVTIYPISSGNAWIEPTLSRGGSGNTVKFPIDEFWAGGPGFTPVIDGSTYITCDNELFTEDNAKSVTWSVYGPMQIVGQTYGYRCTIEGTGNGYGWVYATAANGCDTITSELFVEVDCGYLLVFSPNPASGETILSIESTSEKKIVDETIYWELEVYDNTQNLKLKNSKAQGKEYRFNTSGWKEGIYVARVKYDDKILTGKLVVKR
mgnify:CR=1 FL=1